MTWTTTKWRKIIIWKKVSSVGSLPVFFSSSVCSLLSVTNFKSSGPLNAHTLKDNKNPFYVLQNERFRDAICTGWKIIKWTGAAEEKKLGRHKFLLSWYAVHVAWTEITQEAYSMPPCTHLRREHKMSKAPKNARIAWHGKVWHGRAWWRWCWPGSCERTLF